MRCCRIVEWRDVGNLGEISHLLPLSALLPFRHGLSPEILVSGHRLSMLRYVCTLCDPRWFSATCLLAQSDGGRAWSSRQPTLITKCFDRVLTLSIAIANETLDSLPLYRTLHLPAQQSQPYHSYRCSHLFDYSPIAFSISSVSLATRACRRIPSWYAAQSNFLRLLVPTSG